MGHSQIDQRLSALSQFLVILAQATVVVHPAKVRSTTQRRARTSNPLTALFRLTTCYIQPK